MAINRGIFPGTFTMGNVVCGFLSLLSAFEGNITAACWFVLLAGFLDGLDGKIARLSGTSSQFGVELDSLADFLSFGIAPAIIVHQVKLNTMGKWGWIISIVYIMGSAYRLARYNLMADNEEKRGFLGLPVPAAAFGLVAYVIFSLHLWGEVRYGEILVSMIALFAFLMVSQVEYDSIPDRFSGFDDRVKLVVSILAAVAILFKPRLLLFPFVALYILFGMVRELYRLLTMGVGKVTGRPTGIRRRMRKED